MPEKKETLWSMSTTVREAERIIGFLQTAAQLDGTLWNSETQCRFQILLIQNHEYLKDSDSAQVRNGLSKEQVHALSEWSKDMSYDMAESIFKAKDYTDPAMRGRQSMSPLVKLGLVYYANRPDGTRLFISDMGKKLLAGDITFDEMMLDALLKIQYPNPADRGFKSWNTKPFINTLRLIRCVNQLCAAEGSKAIGISTREFGIFALSLKHYTDVDRVANDILSFRKELEKCPDELSRERFTDDFIGQYLSEFNNPVKNCKEYTDNMVRYLRLTKYIYIRGKYNHTFIDLEPRRTTEINAILQHDNGAARSFTPDEWNSYMGVYGTYELPFETTEQLKAIATDVMQEVNHLERSLQMSPTRLQLPSSKEELKRYIKERRTYRTHLQNEAIKQAVHKDLTRINDTIESLHDICSHNTAKLAKKFSIELEKWTNVALNILDDARLIKPNSPVGDDNEPIYTAPSGVPDIECFYDTFNAICEVTMLKSRDQWYNEGQPVMRHLRAFEDTHPERPSYCLFVAPTLHQDTVNTFYISVKYEYEGKRQRIVPITVSQLVTILTAVKNRLQRHESFTHAHIRQLYDACLDMTKATDSKQWLASIDYAIKQWAS